MTIATVTSKGQITIPADIRADLDIKAGDQIVFFKQIGGGLGVHIRRPKVGSGRGILSAKGRRISIEEIDPAKGREPYDPGGLSLPSKKEKPAT